MLRKLSHIDRITQLQDEIQQVLVIITSTIAYLTSRATFVELSSEVPVTKQRDPTKYDTQYVFDASKKELASDLIMKAKQLEYLIMCLPQPEPEEEQARRLQALDGEMTIANEDYSYAMVGHGPH
ncbi:hypothetical protein C8J57DRAFT_1063864 [Mycena rebaudengoi]|nr:hypothetical protein C8J57DRAFT_1063864 [Mycena rebaudengoi]